MSPAASPASGSAPERVGIVLRTRDRPGMLRRALDDVLAQTSPAWRLVVVNDGGDPEPVDRAVADRHDRAAGRVQVLHRAASTGMEAATNAAMALLGTRWAAVHDDDDTWHPEFLARTTGHLRATGAVAVVARTEIVLERVYPDGYVVETGREPFWADLEQVTLADLLLVNRFVPISLVYERALHDSLGPYDESLPAVGDWEFHLRLAVHHEIAFLGQEPLAFWHQRREASGALGNSTVVAAADHRTSDAAVRDRALRRYAAEHGTGGLLYVSRLVDDTARRTERRLEALEARLEEVLRRLPPAAPDGGAGGS